MTKSELISALESAEVGSRELDGELWKFYTPHKIGHFEDYDDEVILKADGGGGFPFFCWVNNFPEFCGILPHTTSLAAALPGEDIISSIWVDLADREHDYWQARQRGVWQDACAHTEPLARRLAALKAMEKS